MLITKAYLYDVFHRCESTTGWVLVGCSIALSSAQKVEGEYSIKMTPSWPGASEMKYSRTVDWSKFSNIVLWVYHPGYTFEDGWIGLYTDAGNYKIWEFEFAGSWTERVISFTSTPDSSAGTLDLSNITYIKVLQVNADAGEDYYFDFIHARTADITPDITYCKITEELGIQSVADLKIKGDSLDHFNAGLEMEIYDANNVLSWTGRCLYPESVLIGKKNGIDQYIGELKVIGSDSQFNNVYRKNYTTVRDSDYILKDIIDNDLPKFTYDDEIDNFALTYKYDLKAKSRKMFNYLAMLERAVIHYKPNREIFFNKYDNLTASGLSWNQNTSHVKITSYTPAANRHITKTPVIGANNDLGQVYYVGSATDAEIQKYGINELQPWRDSEITNYTEAKQIGDNLQIIYSMDTQMISMLVVGKKHIQVGYTINVGWTGVFSITAHDFLVTKRVWYPMIDKCDIELTDNILTRKRFWTSIRHRFYDEDAQQSYEEPDVAESTVAGTVLNLSSIAELRAQADIKTIKPSYMAGWTGFVKDVRFGATYSVLFSDVNAGVYSTHYVEKGGSFKVMIVHTGTGANNGKTASGLIYVSYTVDGGTDGWDINGNNCDLALGNASIMKYYTYGTAFTVADNSNVGVAWYKDDNAGAAAGTMHVYQIILVRQ